MPRKVTMPTLKFSRREWTEIADVLRSDMYSDFSWAAEIHRRTQRDGADPEERVEYWVSADDDFDFIIQLCTEQLGMEFSSDWNEVKWPL
jgi:hypothetical protein